MNAAMFKLGCVDLLYFVLNQPLEMAFPMLKYMLKWFSGQGYMLLPIYCSIKTKNKHFILEHLYNRFNYGTTLKS